MSEVGDPNNMQSDQDATFTKVQWHLLRGNLDLQLWPLPRIDTRKIIKKNVIEKLEELVKRTMNQCSRMLTKPKNNWYGEISQNFKDIIREKNRARKTVQRTRASEHKRIKTELRCKAKDGLKERVNWDKVSNLSSWTKNNCGSEKILTTERRLLTPNHEEISIVNTNEEKAWWRNANYMYIRRTTITDTRTLRMKSEH